MKTQLALVLALSAFGVGCGGATQSTETTAPSAEAPAQAELARVTIEEVEAAIAANDGSMHIFDANSPETFAEHHIPGATWIQYDGLTAESLPADHNAKLVFYCGNEQCSASHTAARQAIALGYANSAVFSPGIRGWIDAGKPVEAGAPAAAATPAAE